MKKLIPLYIAPLFAAASLQATIVFSDGFETPDVTGQANTQPDDWVASTQGFGAGNDGLVDEDVGTFTTPFGSQAAWASQGDNSGFITAAGVIGSVSVGSTYTLTINLSAIDTSGPAEYTVALIAISSGGSRDDVRANANNSRTLVEQRAWTTDDGTSGGTALYDFSRSENLSYTVESGDPFLGDDVAVLLRKQGGNTILFDNVSVDLVAVPEPSTFGLLAACFGLTRMMVRRRKA